MHIPVRFRALAVAFLVAGIAGGAPSLFGHVAVRAQTTSVSIQGFKFSPDPITVTVGSTVTWTNSDSVAHTATATDGSFDTRALSTGQSGSFTFTQAGTFSYMCSIHPFMHGTVNVVAAQPSAGSQPAQTTATAAPAGNATAAAGNSVQLAAGANLIGVPSGTMLSGATVYSYSAQSNNYTQLGPSDALQGGQGYWAELDAATSLTLGAGSNAPVSTTAAANAWQLIGNPSGTQPALVTGADTVYTYNALTNAYTTTTMLNPGQGAWAISARGGTITIAPGGKPAPVATPVPAQAPAPASQPVTQPAPAATQPPMTYPYPHY